jgi:uncharacterized protein (DUF1697 family)
MPQYIAFLRAVNVGGHTVTMAHLRGLFEALAFTAVETFIASGNVIFSSPSKSSRATLQKLEQKIEAHLLKSLGYPVSTFLRTPSEVAAIAAHQPFRASQIAAAPTFWVGFIAQPLSPLAVKSLMALRTPDDDFHVRAREVYWLSRLRQSESKFSGALFERTFKLPITFRNLNTISRLAAKYPSA